MVGICKICPKFMKYFPSKINELWFSMKIKVIWWLDILKSISWLSVFCCYTCLDLPREKFFQALVKNHFMASGLRNFVIEGMACQMPSRLQATPLLQTSLVRPIFSDVILGKNLWWYSGKQTSYWSTTGFFSVCR